MNAKAGIVHGGGSFVELAPTRKGKIFRKQLLKKGTYAHPNIAGEKMVIDDEVLEKVVANFNAGVVDHVQVPLVGDKNEHTDDPTRNIGEIVGMELSHDGTGVDALYDIRKHADDVGKTLLGTSALLHFNYTDTASGSKVGPTVLHAAITNRPYIRDMAPFEEVIAASADLEGSEVAVLALSEDKPDKPTKETEDMPKTVEELLAELKSQHNIDVEALRAKAEKADALEEEKNELSGIIDGLEAERDEANGKVDATLAALSSLRDAGVVQLSDGQGGTPTASTVSADEVGRAVVELAGKVKERDTALTALADEVKELRQERQNAALSAATSLVEDYIRQGRIKPPAKEKMVALAMSDRETFDLILPDQPMLPLGEVGLSGQDEDTQKRLDGEVSRYVEMARGNGKAKAS